MAPRGRRTEAAEPQAFHELGVRGRKTGAVLPDHGDRDEYGMQPLESIFSSPRKSTAVTRNDDDESGSEDMEIASNSGPGPSTLLQGRRSVQYPIPKSRSPLKTNLNSPARRNPHLDRLSSPTRGSIVEERDSSVTRKLDFSNRSNGPRPAGRGPPNGADAQSFVQQIVEDDEEDEELPDADDEPDLMDVLDDPVPMGDDDDIPEFDDPPDQFDDDVEEPEEEDVEEVRPAPQVRQKGPSPAKARPMLTRSPKRRRSARESVDDEDAEIDPESKEEQRPAKKRARGPAAPATAGPSKARASSVASSRTDGGARKPRGRPPKKRLAQVAEDDAGETSFVALQRGPPLPKSRGLVSIRRDDAVTQTRSGRHSYRPVDYWRGEEIILETEERNGDDSFVLPSIKEVRRVPEEPYLQKKHSKYRPKPAKGKSRAESQLPEEDPPEEWEVQEGKLEGNLVYYDPEEDPHPPAEGEEVPVATGLLAYSATGVDLKEVKGMGFKFGKVITLPFMGAGIVELPPGTQKKPKNSRGMQMIFFVQYGKLAVTVNENSFVISAGGTWLVPRWNYYSISNEFDKTSRVFFAQANEVEAQPLEEA